jgi:hypothetical protein
MKYRLLKEFPFVDPGTVLNLWMNGLFLTDNKTMIIPFNARESTQVIDELIKNGWIEELKPREFWLLVQAGSVRAGFTEKHHCCSEDINKLIKVREVLE